MKATRIPFAAVALLLALPAAGASFTGTTDLIIRGITDLSEATSNVTESIFDDKVVRAARDDAARFVATEGSQRGACLEAALLHLRHHRVGLEASDLQLAEAILAH